MVVEGGNVRGEYVGGKCPDPAVDAADAVNEEGKRRIHNVHPLN